MALKSLGPVEDSRQFAFVCTISGHYPTRYQTSNRTKNTKGRTRCLGRYAAVPASSISAWCPFSEPVDAYTTLFLNNKLLTFTILPMPCKHCRLSRISAHDLDRVCSQVKALVMPPSHMPDRNGDMLIGRCGLHSMVCGQRHTYIVARLIMSQSQMRDSRHADRNAVLARSNCARPPSGLPHFGRFGGLCDR